LGTFAAWYHWSTPGLRSRGVAAGLWMGFALLSRRQADAVVPILVALAFLDAISSRRLREFAGLLAGLVPAVIGRLAYNFARFGNPWFERHPGLTTEKVAASVSHGRSRILEILFSDSEGLVVYALVPILIAVLGARGLWRASRRDAIAAVTIVTGGIAFLGILPFSPGVSFGARYLVYLIAFLGLAWPFVRFPTGMPARIAWGLPVACSMLLMATGFAIDPLPVYLRMGRQLPHVGQFHAIALEWRRILSPVDLPDDPVLEASPDWRHDPFRRPDFWWCHLWARSHGAKPPPPTPAPGPSVKPREPV
jgi:hypothetical protein